MIIDIASGTQYKTILTRATLANLFMCKIYKIRAVLSVNIYGLLLILTSYIILFIAFNMLFKLASIGSSISIINITKIKPRTSLLYYVL